MAWKNEALMWGTYMMLGGISLSLFLNVILTLATVIASAVAFLTYRRYSKVVVRIRSPLVFEIGKLPIHLSYESFPFSSLKDGIEHLKSIPIEIHNDSESKSVSVYLVWIEVFDYPPEKIIPLIEGKISLSSTMTQVSVEEPLPIFIKPKSLKTIHISIKVAGEIWEKYNHKVGMLKVSHSFGISSTDIILLDSFWEYYGYVAHYVAREVLKRERDSLKRSQTPPDDFLDYVESIYGKLGFVPELGLVELTWMLNVKDPFLKQYAHLANKRLTNLTKQIYSLTALKEGEIIPTAIVVKAVPKNIKSVLEFIQELEKKYLD